MIEVRKDTKQVHSEKVRAKIVGPWVIVKNNVHSDPEK